MKDKYKSNPDEEDSLEIRTNYNDRRRIIRKNNEENNIPINVNNNSCNKYNYFDGNMKEKINRRKNTPISINNPEIENKKEKKEPIKSNLKLFSTLNNKEHTQEQKFRPQKKPQSSITSKYPGGETWGGFLSKTSAEGHNKKALNSKTYQSNVFPDENCNDENERRHFKASNFIDYGTKTQITTLPGGVKRGHFEIKDDVNFKINNSESRLYKLIHDYNNDLTYDDAHPIGQGYNENTFPVNERFHGSYKRGVIDHDIFNLKSKDIDNNNENKKTGKKIINNNTFKSQFEFI